MSENKKPKSIARLLIDLTPLLDVIFIVLIVVLAGQENYNSEADRKYEEAEQLVIESETKVSDMEAVVGTYTEQMKAYETVNEYVNVATVYAAYQPGNRRTRTIYVMINNDEPVQINLTPSNTDKAWSECRKLIEDTIKKDESLPIILSINTNDYEKMLYRDEESIYSIFKSLKDLYGMVTIR